MYEAIEHWKQYKQEKITSKPMKMTPFLINLQKQKANKVKFNHLEIFNITISYVYIVSLLSIFIFCASIIVEKY